MAYIFDSRIKKKEDAQQREFKTAKAAATAAWEFCGDCDLEMPSTGWTLDHPRFGKRTCYDMMVPKGDDWEPDTAFI